MRRTWLMWKILWPETMSSTLLPRPPLFQLAFEQLCNTIKAIADTLSTSNLNFCNYSLFCLSLCFALTFRRSTFSTLKTKKHVESYSVTCIQIINVTICLFVFFLRLLPTNYLIITKKVLDFVAQFGCIVDQLDAGDRFVAVAVVLVHCHLFVARNASVRRQI